MRVGTWHGGHRGQEGEREKRRYSSVLTGKVEEGFGKSRRGMVVVVLEGGRLLRKAIAVSDDQTGADGVNREVVDRMEQQIGIAPEGKKTTTVPAIHKIEEWLEDYW
jgi:hypothetical protein